MIVNIGRIIEVDRDLANWNLVYNLKLFNFTFLFIMIFKIFQKCFTNVITRCLQLIYSDWSSRSRFRNCRFGLDSWIPRTCQVDSVNMLARFREYIPAGCSSPRGTETFRCRGYPRLYLEDSRFMYSPYNKCKRFLYLYNLY